MTSNFTTATLEAYERWAPLYPPLPHNPLMRAEQRAMIEYLPELAGGRVLDLACGTGRYSRILAETPAADVIAVDFCDSMLRRASATNRVRASMMDLPFRDGVFDLVISGLAVGHAPDVDLWMAEIARVLGKGGTLLYSDFHPAAARAGLPRTFKDETDHVWTVPHRCHEVPSQLAAAAAAGLVVDVTHDIRMGFEVRERFPRAEEFYRRWHGLPIVLVVRARK